MATGAKRDGRPAAAGTERLRIVIVDDHPIVRRGLAMMINAEPGMTVCGESDTVDGGFTCIRRNRPDVAIVDLSLGRLSGFQLVEVLATAAPAVRILVLSMHDELLYAERALAAGAHGYIMKIEATNSLVEAIRCVAAGKTYVSSTVSERILGRLGDRRRLVTTAPIERLTKRELEVFRLIGQGLPSREIASTLDLSVKTIETHEGRIKQKLGLAHNRDLIRAAVIWLNT